MKHPEHKRYLIGMSYAELRTLEYALDYRLTHDVQLARESSNYEEVMADLAQDFRLQQRLTDKCEKISSQKGSR